MKDMVHEIEHSGGVHPSNGHQPEDCHIQYCMSLGAIEVYRMTYTYYICIHGQHYRSWNQR